MTARSSPYVPLSVRRSWIVSWLWLRTEPGCWLHYDRAKRLARWLP